MTITLPRGADTPAPVVPDWMTASPLIGTTPTVAPSPSAMMPQASCWALRRMVPSCT